MPNPNIPLPSQNMEYEQFRRYVGDVVNRLNYLFKNIEGLNIKEMTFDLEKGAKITINRKGIVINNGKKDTLKVDIEGNLTMEGIITALGGIIGGWTIGPDKLSGNGKIQGGTIIGSEIKTSETAYPRAEVSATSKLIRLLSSPTQRIEVVTDTNSGIPNIFFYDGNKLTGAYMSPNGTFNIITQFITAGANINLQGYDIWLRAFSKVMIESWSKLSTENQTLQQALDSKAPYFTGYTGVVNVGTQSLLISNGIITGVV